MIRFKKLMAGMYSYHQKKNKQFLIIKNGKGWDVKLDGNLMTTEKSLDKVRAWISVNG